MSNESRTQFSGRSGAVLCLVLLVALVVWLSPDSWPRRADNPSPEVVDVPRPASEPTSKFLRFVPGSPGQGQLQSAIVNYRRGDGARVALIAVVHVGDGRYYAELEELFESYDALLYEMIKPKDVSPVRAGSSGGLLSSFQRLIQDTLALEFQLDAIDYGKTNFVHADLDPETFFRLQEERGETFSGMLFRAMLHQWKLMAQGEDSQLNGMQLLLALTSEDSASSLKLLFAKEFHEIEKMTAGLEGPDGSVLLSGRNEKAMEVLEEELDRGKKHLAIFYGAAHMPDMEERLRRLGFEKIDERWLIAWDVRKKVAKESEGFRIPWFSGPKKARD